MKSFSVQLIGPPFPYWLGPFSPARGVRSGFRFHQGRFGTWVENEQGREFWPLVDSSGARALTHLVQERWGGGRVLLLPNGLVVKPLQGDDEVGRRVVIGLFSGPVVFAKPEGGVFDLSNPGRILPGAPWPGPRSTGLECIIQADGSLECNWFHPTATGRDEVWAVLHAPDRALSSGFRAARPSETCGRVRVTANGHVVTNRKKSDGSWVSTYVGHIAQGSWHLEDHWIEMEHA